MTNYEMLELAKRYRIEVAIALVVVVVALVGVVYYAGANSATTKLAATERSLRVAEQDLKVLQGGNEKQTLEEELKKLSSGLVDQSLPSTNQALELAVSLTQNAVQNRAELVGVSKEDTLLTIGSGSYRAIQVQIKVTTSWANINDMLKLVDDFGAARISTLELTRSEQDKSSWTASVTILIPYF